MRQGGATQAEIARALDVPGSTIARWAAEGGWRVCDMAGVSAAGLHGGDPSGLPPSPHPNPPLEGREDTLDALPASLPRGAAWRLMARAMTLALAGRTREADFTAKLAERLARTMRLAGPTPDEEDADAAEQAEAEEGELEELRAELKRRLTRIRVSHTLEQMERAAWEHHRRVLTEADKADHLALRRQYGFRD